MKTNFELRLGELAKQAEDYLRGCLQYADEPQKRLFDAMQYSLLAGGKRLRMILCMEFCRICGGNVEAAMPFAAAVEMIHTYSLIHDDLPCMDDDDYRRGKLTNHKVFGEAMAVLAGDGLLTEAFQMLTTAKLSAEQIVDAVSVLSQCAGCCGMVGGQVLDIMSEERELTEEEVRQIQTRKTGALIVAACLLGVIAAKGSQQLRDKARSYASDLGLAFQIQDDILDVIGDDAKLGKATGVDENKNTFVRLYGLAVCEKMVDELSANAKKTLLEISNDADFLCELTMQLAHRDH